MSSDLELVCYAAGVIDSDGCITIKRRRVRTAAEWKMYPTVFVRQVQDGAVKIMESLFGGSTRVHGPSIPGGRDLFHWEISCTRAVSACRVLLPHLRIKDQQARVVIEFGEFLSDTKLRRRATWFQWRGDEPCYTVSEACDVYGCNRQSIYQAMHNGTVPSRLSGRRRLIPKRFWDSWNPRARRNPIADEYKEKRDEFRHRIHSLNGPTRGVKTSDRMPAA